MLLKILTVVIGLGLAPLVGGLISGLDRKITARMQSRFGPPIFQPFYDVLKLLGKKPMSTNVWLIFSAYMYLLASAVALVIFFSGGDILLLFFVFTIGAVFQVVGALSVPSPFSQVGAQRELLQMLAYEPLIIMAIVGIAKLSGSFMIADIFKLNSPILIHAPLLFLALGYALTIKLRKSPFDIAGSHHGHQELVRGIQTEYSGPYLALLEIAHWLDIVLLLGLCALFWHTSVIGMIILVGITYFAEILIDNISARMTWQWMLKTALCFGVGLAALNLLWLYAI